MDSLPNIPTPFKQRMRELRIAFLPVITFALVILGTILMWRDFVMPATILGEVETVQYNVLAKEDGVLTELTVDRFSEVTKDQHIGLVNVMDKELQEAELAAIEADLRTLNTRINLDKGRNQESITRLKLTLHEQKMSLEQEEADLIQKAAEYEREVRLVNSVTNIIPEAQLDIARRDRDKAQGIVEKRRKLITDWESDLKALVETGVYQVSGQDNTIEQNIKAAREKLLLSSKPLTLKAPVAGKVNAVLKRAGERVLRGEAILTLTPQSSSKIVGYVRQPLNLIPNVNDKVTIKTRSQKRQLLHGTILQVGPSWTALNPALIAPDIRRREVGLPILIQLDDNLQLTPGEFVDISLVSPKQASATSGVKKQS